FLDRNAIYDAGGARISQLQPSPDRMYLLLPEHLASEQEAWVEAYRYDHQEEDTPTPLDIQVVLTRSGQQIFNYGSLPDAPMTTDTPVAVISTSSTVGMHPTADVSSGGGLFVGMSELRTDVLASPMAPFVSGVTSVSSEGILQAELRQRLLLTNVVALMLLCGTFLIASATFARAYVEAGAKRIFVSWINGVTFFAMHRRVIVVVGILTSAIGGACALGARVGTPGQILAILLLGAPAVAVFVVGLRRASMKVVSREAADA
ncbi:MAG: hypothetical protein ACK5LS_09125, partial [Propioniciclava sp.]